MNSATHTVQVRALGIYVALEILRSEEGDSVTVLCDNPDGPNAIDCCGDWTGYEDKRFEGVSTLDALNRAVEAYKAAGRARHAAEVEERALLV